MLTNPPTLVFLVGAFNQEKVLIGAFYVIVKPSFQALDVTTFTMLWLAATLGENSKLSVVHSTGFWNFI